MGFGKGARASALDPCKKLTASKRGTPWDSELLLEIGTEEIPARFLPPVMEEMAASLPEALEQERIAVGEIDHLGHAPAPDPGGPGPGRRLKLGTQESRPPQGDGL